MPGKWSSDARDLFYDPQHPYTKALLGSVPSLGSKAPWDVILAFFHQDPPFPRPAAIFTRAVPWPWCAAVGRTAGVELGDSGAATCWLLDRQAEVVPSPTPA